MPGERVLVVDDGEAIRAGLTLALSQAGYDVRSAPDGRKALREFFDFQPALVLLDIVMPGMNGFEVCEQMRAASDTPVIFLSSLEDEPYKIQAFNTGADDYVIKGIGMAELLARVAANLRRAAARGEA